MLKKIKMVLAPIVAGITNIGIVGFSGWGLFEFIDWAQKEYEPFQGLNGMNQIIFTITTVVAGMSLSIYNSIKIGKRVGDEME